MPVARGSCGKDVSSQCEILIVELLKEMIFHPAQAVLLKSRGAK
jgi:hypothetical protein